MFFFFLSLLQAETAKAELEEERRQVRPSYSALDNLMLFFFLSVMFLSSVQILNR